MDIYLADVPSGNISIFTKEKPDKINDLYDFIYKEEETYPMKKTRFHEDYYGITWAKGRLFVTHGEWPSSLLEYDSSGKILNRFLPPKNHIQMFRAHQITSIDNHIIITSTLNDTLFRFDIKTEEWDYFSIIESNFKRIYAPDKHHLNSVWYSDKKLYLILNNKGESALNIYDYPQMSLIESKILGQKVHNVWKMKDQIWFCNSGDGTVRSEKGEKITVGHWSRGVALSEDYLVLGASGLGGRNARRDKESIVHVFDAKSLKPLNKFYVTGNINEIRMVGTQDKSHISEVYHINERFKNISFL